MEKDEPIILDFSNIKTQSEKSKNSIEDQITPLFGDAVVRNVKPVPRSNPNRTQFKVRVCQMPPKPAPPLRVNELRECSDALFGEKEAAALQLKYENIKRRPKRSKVPEHDPIKFILEMTSKPTSTPQKSVCKDEVVPLFKTDDVTISDITDFDRKEFPGFSDADIATIKTYIKKINLNNRMSLISIGQEVNERLTSLVNDLVEFSNKKLKDTGLDDQIAKLKARIDDPLKKENKSFISKLFSKKKETEKVRDELISDIDSICSTLKNQIDTLKFHIPVLDKLLDQTKRQHRKLQLVIEACKFKIAEFNKSVKPSNEKTIAQSNNVLDVQNAKDLIEAGSMLENRSKTLEMLVYTNELTLTQIRVSRMNNVKMIETLSNILSTLIPVWKQNIVINHTQIGVKDLSATSIALNDSLSQLLQQKGK
jgi:uncharacterized protein YaaN involved in tellurite resistance